VKGLHGVSEGLVIACLFANHDQREAARMLKPRYLDSSETERGFFRQVLKTFSDRLQNSHEVFAVFFRRWSDGRQRNTQQLG
jgi:hypothetical protein